MSSQNMDALFKAQTETIAAQAKTIKTMEETIAGLMAFKDQAEREKASLRREIEVKETRNKRLEGYFEDFGVNLSAIEASQLWWPKAKKAVSINVDAAKIDNDPSLENEDQKGYVKMVAESVLCPR